MTSASDNSNSGSPTRSTRTVYVDWTDLEQRLAAGDGASQAAKDSGTAPPRRRLLTTVREKTQPIRSNVKDAAEAVLTWVASLSADDDPQAIHEALDHCLRPGPDIERVNYTHLAASIQKRTGVVLSPKRVKTAVAELRRAKQRDVDETQSKQQEQEKPDMRGSLNHLQDRLRGSFTTLIQTGAEADMSTRRAVAVDVLSAVRAGAGRVIEAGFGEGIPDVIDIDALQMRYTDFVRDAVRDRQPDADVAIAGDLGRLVDTLDDYDGSATGDMRLVVDGARVVGSLMGPDSLPGLLAQLNVLVAGRHLIVTDLYVAEMTRLADACYALKDDADAAQFHNWIRRQPEHQRTPSPTRMSSYCLTNAATRIGDRLFTDDLEPDSELSPADWLTRAMACLDLIKQRDSGFQLIPTTELILLLAASHVNDDEAMVVDHFKNIGEAKTLAVVEDLVKFDNCQPLVTQAHQLACKAIPAVRGQIIRL